VVVVVGESREVIFPTKRYRQCRNDTVLHPAHRIPSPPIKALSFSLSPDPRLCARSWQLWRFPLDYVRRRLFQSSTFTGCRLPCPLANNPGMLPERPSSRLPTLYCMPRPPSNLHHPPSHTLSFGGFGIPNRTFPHLENHRGRWDQSLTD
jgi:hypothetical protein